ncbi:VOC family protein [Paenibacillus ginsengarvi]|uniref:VOC family protein n=1 Tax=Paenibacillus ginsengarvi TaxID=400777 RepID=A0A3B0BXU2_9BACL|nr:VOC family protein [Paenibacillus ginsengarvi]RKN77049.1 VOC family protein [Paenibacillus ginsengarvi]
MGESIRKARTNLKKRKNADGYKPTTIPNILKLINRNEVEEEKQEITNSFFVADKKGDEVMNKPLVKMSSNTLFVNDLQKSIKWYYKSFGFQMVSINTDFATLEYAPGRCLFINKDKNSPRKLDFFCRNINALRRQLVDAEVDIEIDEEFHMKIVDLNGNTIHIWNNQLDMDKLQASMPDLFLKNLIRCGLETKDEMHLLACIISSDSEFKTVSNQLQDWCRQHNVSVQGEAFISSHYSGQTKDVPFNPSIFTGQVNASYVCIPLSSAPLKEQLPSEAQYIHIPPLDYLVFTIDYLHIDQLRQSQLKNRVHFMNSFLNKPETFYIHEYYKDDYIYAYIPYLWVEGRQEPINQQEIDLNPVGRVSRQYFDMLYSTLYASDPLASAKWFVDVLGCEIKDQNQSGVVMQISPGAYFLLSKDEDSPRGLSFICDDTKAVREQLTKIKIDIIQEDNNNWFLFKGPDNNNVDVWGGGFGMNKLSIHLPK